MPSLEFTSVPAYGATGNLEGRVKCAQAEDYNVAVYIYIGGWWTKPSFAEPLTAVQRNGVWVAPIVTGGEDRHATKIAAFLVPAGFDPPAASGAEELPNALYDHAVANQEVSRGPDSSAGTASISFEVNGDTVTGTVAPPAVCNASYKVALYAYTNHWYVQPYADERRNIEINDDCTWNAGTNQWTQLAAHLVAANLDLKPEIFSESACPPPPLDPAVDPEHVFAYKCTE